MIRKAPDIKVFFQDIEYNNLYCYGAGNVLKDFLCSYSDIDVVAVVDGNKQENEINFGEREIPIITPEQLAEHTEKIVLLITCFDYQNVVSRLEELYTLRGKKDNLIYYIYCEMRQFVSNENDIQRNTGKYQITEFRMLDYNAGQKAPADAARIAANSGFKALTVIRGTASSGILQTQQQWNLVCDEIEYNSTVFIQYPIIDQSDGVNKLIRLRYEKNIKIICLIHDIQLLRSECEIVYGLEYDFLKELADIWIVHNERMKKLLIEKGFSEERIVCLGIFDYLIDNPSEVIYSDGVIVAGNLDKAKSEYIYHLKEIKGIMFNLFGANYNDIKYNNITYYGSFLPDDLISNLRGKYGLVWDGNTVHTCGGNTGRYLRYNNPHKMSLYLAVGLPVVVWKQSATAEFVINEKIGIVVDSLYDLPKRLKNISQDNYNEMKKNAIRIGERIRGGKYLEQALMIAENMI